MTQKHSSGKSSPAALTYYKLLGLPPNASEVDIRRAYRQKSKLYHPDTTKLPPEKAAEQFQQIKEAYAILNNAETRYNYDEQLRPITSGRHSYSPGQQSVANVDSKQRPLSPGEIFALFLLGITFLACLVLALVVGTAQSEGWRTAQHPPDWSQSLVTWFQQPITTAPTLSPAEDHRPLELDRALK